MINSVRKEERHTFLLHIAACAAVVFATILAAGTPPQKSSIWHQFVHNHADKQNALQLADQEIKIALIDQVRSEAMLRARQEYGGDK